MAALYKGELERRVALLHRFRELLLQQRGKFLRYLEVLDHEKADIEDGDLDRLVAHVEIEESIVSEIYTFQKVIDPLEELYRAAGGTYLPAAEAFAGSQAAGSGAAEATNYAEAKDLPSIKGALADLSAEVLRRNEENRGLLKRRMELVRGEILALRRPGAAASVYAAGGEGKLLDISG